MGQRERNDALVKSAQEMIENDYHNKIMIDGLKGVVQKDHRIVSVAYRAKYSKDPG